MPAILQDKNVVLAAETGSGKTLAYLAPLAHFALNPATSRLGPPVRAAAADAEANFSQFPPHPAAAASDQPHQPNGLTDDEDTTSRDARPMRAAALVLCPNVPLCEQAASVARAALADAATGRPLASVAVVASQSPPPLTLPDIVITTPGALLSVISAGGSYYGPLWTRTGLETWARRVVLDEADLLLAGGYAKQISALLDLLKVGDRERAARRACAEFGIPLDAYWEMQRHVRQAVQRGGAKAAREAGYSPPPAPKPSKDAPIASNSSSSSSGRGEAETATFSRQRSEAGAFVGASSDDIWEEMDSTKSASAKVEALEDAPWQRQYVFVAATMPTEGGHTVGAELAASFPSAVWLAGRQLHMTGHKVDHTWRSVGSEGERAQALRVSAPDWWWVCLMIFPHILVLNF